MEVNVENKTFLISGGTSGLGFGIAKILANSNANISVASSSDEKVEKAKKEFSGISESKILVAKSDVRDPDQIKRWVASSVEKFGNIDGIVINAGGPPALRFEEISEDQWNESYNLTLMSSIRMVREVLPFMKKNKKGSILLISSISVKEPIENMVLSNVFRSAAVSLMKTLSKDLAKYNIRVNNIMPGRIDTDRIKSLDETNSKNSGLEVSEIIKQNHSKIPLGRYGEVEEFAKAAVFLLSDDASFITGASLVVDGGMVNTVW